MSDEQDAVLPVYALATREVRVPGVGLDGSMSPARLAELRTVLAAMADAPIVTLEALSVPRDLDRSHGIALHAASPLANHLTNLITNTSRTTSAASQATATGEVLYRMVVPAKIAGQFTNDAIKPMVSKAAKGGRNLRNALDDSIKRRDADGDSGQPVAISCSLVGTVVHGSVVINSSSAKPRPVRAEAV